MKENKRIISIQNGRTLGTATPQKKEPPREHKQLNEGKGLGKSTSAKK